MSVAAIEINDAAVLGAVDGVVREASPGYALLSVEPPAVGEEALRVSRAEPLSVNNHFWDDLDERPMIGRMAGGRSHADLAYLHLAKVWSGLREGAPVSGSRTWQWTTAAPALAASTAASAICFGVIGTWLDFEMVSPEPVTAQVMMTLRWRLRWTGDVLMVGAPGYSGDTVSARVCARQVLRGVHCANGSCQ